MPEVLTADDVPRAFDEAAPAYDRMVGLNPGYHRHLRSAAQALVSKLPGPTARLVDLGCGSGASIAALLAALAATGRSVDILGVDASAGMLAQAERKDWPAGVRFFPRRAQDLAILRDDLGLAGAVDGVLAAYLFRNVDALERDEVLKEVGDLLRPGGVLVVQEYSVAGSTPAALVWSLVCWSVVIPLSWLTSRQTRLYRYLWRSVRRFDAVQEFTDRLYAAGFTEIEVRTVPGWQAGILHTFRAVRAAEESDGPAYKVAR
ncbi:MAG: class I SAM-dependent methyltransferase [Actinomycetes bacterium]